MPAADPSPLSIIISALRKLGVMGAALSSPKAEDLELGLNEFNEIAEMRNLRERNCFFQRTQQFTITTARTSYTIGATADSPNFVVTAGRRPVRLLFAALVMTGNTPNVNLDVYNMTPEQYHALSVPEVSSTLPTALYYVPTWPNGTIYPYPASPSDTSNKVELTWSNQFETVLIGDVSTTMALGFGLRRALALDVAVALYLAFPKRTDLEELKRQQREAWIEVTSANKTPPFIDTTDGISSDTGGGFNWLSRTPS